jgi:hypothetical protein
MLRILFSHHVLKSEHLERANSCYLFFGGSFWRESFGEEFSGEKFSGEEFSGGKGDYLPGKGGSKE